MSPRAFLIVFAAIAAIAASWYGTGRTAAEPAYRFGKVDRGDISDIVTATGTLNAVTTVQIGSQVSGRIAAIHADFNDRVKKGDVLAQIDPTPFEAQVAQAEGNSTKARAASQRTSAAVEVARANELIAASEVVSSQASLNKAQVLAENAERTWNRVRELEQRKMMSTSELDGAQTELSRAKAEVRAALAQVESARARAGASRSQVRQALAETEANRGEMALADAQVLLARTNLGFTRIVSPIDGIVVSRNVDVGQTVAASFQAPVLFLIADDLTRMQIIANVDEADIGRVREGQEATFTVDAYPQRTFRGRVSQIRLAPIVSQNVVTYHVVVEVANPRLLLKPGMTSNVSLLVARRSDALRVPNAALAFNPPGAPRSAPSAERAGSEVRPQRGDGARSEGRRGEGRGGRRGSREGTGATTATSHPETGQAATLAHFDSSEGSSDSERPRRQGVHVLRGAEAVRVGVTTGITDGSYTELLSDALREGDEVIVGTTGGSSAENRSSSPAGLLRMRGGRGGSSRL